MSKAQHESRILFPLRSNVALFKTMEGFLALSERLKVAAVLYDKLILEGGFYTLQASASGVIEIHEARRTLSAEQARKKRAFYEGLSRQEPASEFAFAVKASDSPGEPTPLIVGRTEALYFAELQSLVEELDRYNQPWIEWLDGEIPAGSKADKWVRQQDVEDEALTLSDEYGNSFVRPKLIHALNHDLALAAICKATLSADPLHMGIVEQKLDILGFVPTGQNLVVQMRFPAIKDLPWDELVDLRREPGMVDFRRVVDEIEAEVASLPEVNDSDALRNHVIKQWDSRLVELLVQLQPSLKQVSVGVGKDLVFDLIPIPGLGTLASVAEGVIKLMEGRRSWVSVFMRLAK